MLRLISSGIRRRWAGVEVTMQGSMGRHRSPTSLVTRVMPCATFPKVSANFERMPVASSANQTSALSHARPVYRQSSSVNKATLVVTRFATLIFADNAWLAVLMGICYTRLLISPAKTPLNGSNSVFRLPRRITLKHRQECLQQKDLSHIETMACSQRPDKEVKTIHCFNNSHYRPPVAVVNKCWTCS